MKKFLKVLFIIVGIGLVVFSPLYVVGVPLIVIGCCCFKKDPYEKSVDESALTKVKLKEKEEAAIAEVIRADKERSIAWNLYAVNVLYRKFKKPFPKAYARIDLLDSEYVFHIIVPNLNDEGLYTYRKYVVGLFQKYGDNAMNFGDNDQQERIMRSKCIDYLNGYFKEDPLSADEALEVIANSVSYQPNLVQYGIAPYEINFKIGMNRFPQIDELVKKKKVRQSAVLAKLLILAVNTNKPEYNKK